MSPGTLAARALSLIAVCMVCWYDHISVLLSTMWNKLINSHDQWSLQAAGPATLRVTLMV